MSETNAVNDQITNAVTQVNRLLAEEGDENSQAMARQVMVQAVAMAMQNAVAQQQQAYILRNAATTAAVKAILDASPKEALALVHQKLPGEDVVATLGGLRQLMDELTEPRRNAKTGTAGTTKTGTATKRNRVASGRKANRPASKREGKRK